MNSWRRPSVNRRTQTPFGVVIPIAAGFVALQASSLLIIGLPPICTCGFVDLWHGNPSGPQTSQHLTDWYTYTHIIHGVGFYLLLWLIAPQFSFGLRLALAVGFEAGWEIFENTPVIMDRYRQSALAHGYFGDSVVNSVFDTFATAVGFLLARISPIWSSIALVILLELFLGYMIRDNLTLNIIQLVHPSDTLSTWQSGS